MGRNTHNRVGGFSDPDRLSRYFLVSEEQKRELLIKHNHLFSTVSPRKRTAGYKGARIDLEKAAADLIEIHIALALLPGSE